MNDNRSRGTLRGLVLVGLMLLALFPQSPTPESATAQDDPGPAVTAVRGGSSNIVFGYGGQPGVDDTYAFNPSIVVQDGTYHMFYVTRVGTTDPLSISYASSADGLVWTPYEGNPVLTASGEGFERSSVLSPAAWIAGDGSWRLAYSGMRNLGIALGDAIHLASAPAPAGPWERVGDPVLLPGDTRRWDFNEVAANSVIATDEGLRMYYSALPEFAIGMATSEDGETFSKHDDPSTDNVQLRGSDPVLGPGTVNEWDGGGAFNGGVLCTDEGWLLFYVGFSGADFGFSLGYPATTGVGMAYSDDGVTWTRSIENPLVLADPDQTIMTVFPVQEDGFVRLYMTVMPYVQSGSLPQDEELVGSIAVAEVVLAWE